MGKKLRLMAVIAGMDLLLAAALLWTLGILKLPALAAAVRSGSVLSPPRETVTPRAGRRTAYQRIRACRRMRGRETAL